MICKFIFFRNQSSLITMREKELTIRPTDYIPQNAIKSNVIKNVAKNLECIKCMLSGSFATLWMTTHRMSCI